MVEIGVNKRLLTLCKILVDSRSVSRLIFYLKTTKPFPFKSLEKYRFVDFLSVVSSSLFEVTNV